MTKQELYKEYIHKCSSAPGRLNNYIDFKCIHECICEMENVDDFSLYDIDDPEVLVGLVKRLKQFPKFKNYNNGGDGQNSGKDQYLFVLDNYEAFLRARKFGLLFGANYGENSSGSFLPESEPFTVLYRFAHYVFKNLSMVDELLALQPYLSEKSDWYWIENSKVKSGLFRKQLLQGQTSDEPIKYVGKDVYVASGWDKDDKLTCPSFGVLKYIVDNFYSKYFRIELRKNEQNKDAYVLVTLGNKSNISKFNSREEACSNSVLSKFVFDVFCEFENVDNLQSFVSFANYTNARKDNAKVIKFQADGLDTLVSIMLIATSQEVETRNSGIKRWFDEKTFKFNGSDIYLSTQWSDLDSGDLTFGNLSKYISLAYSNYKIEKVGSEFKLYKFGTLSNASPLDLPYQSIYYGTPGTGKSHAAKLEEAKFDKVFRTTFHPEYDYASFVGCYKPKTDIVDNTKVIIYDFDPQVFTKAYEYAWSRPEKKVLLLIEEINRGNCAQIFGDLFQLLDRDNNGVSKYPINVDLDMLGYLKSKLQESHPEAVAESQIKLPGNFYIIATMNTSDQSLFPMDSAFKRRWVWKYFPITEYTQRVFKIKIAGSEYKWWDFIQEVNKRIESVTMSPDKQIGYWFINPDTDVIESEEFVGKVLFYLWNDVFKDYPDNSESPFMNIKFKDMFNVDGSPNDANIIKFMQELNLMKSNEHNSIPFAPEVRPLSMAAEPQAES